MSVANNISALKNFSSSDILSFFFVSFCSSYDKNLHYAALNSLTERSFYRSSYKALKLYQSQHCHPNSVHVLFVIKIYTTPL